MTTTDSQTEASAGKQVRMAAIESGVRGLIEEILDLARRFSRRERRGTPRLPFTRPINIYIGDPSQKSIRRQAYTINVSRTGMAFLGSKPLDKRTNLVLEIPRRGGAVLVPARVVSCSEVVTGIFRIACAYCLNRSARL